MSGHEALDAARAAGVSVDTDGTDLVLTVPEPTPKTVIDLLKRNKLSILALLGDQSVPWTAQDWQALYIERAKLLQLDEGLPPAQASALAYEACLMEWLVRNAVYTTPQACCHCSGPERAGQSLLPIGIGGAGEAWMHQACVVPWRAARRAEAISALASMELAAPAPDALFSVPQTIDRLILSRSGQR
jgi:hypothetical protein